MDRYEKAARGLLVGRRLGVEGAVSKQGVNALLRQRWRLRFDDPRDPRVVRERFAQVNAKIRRVLGPRCTRVDVDAAAEMCRHIVEVRFGRVEGIPNLTDCQEIHAKGILARRALVQLSRALGVPVGEVVDQVNVLARLRESLLADDRAWRGLGP